MFDYLTAGEAKDLDHRVAGFGGATAGVNVHKDEVVLSDYPFDLRGAFGVLCKKALEE